MGGDPYGGSDPTADDCIRAGIYWFSRRDLEAARAWWERARELDAGNPKALECLRLLGQFEQRSEEPPPPEPSIQPSFTSVDLDPAGWRPGRAEPPPDPERQPAAEPTPAEKGVWPPPPDPARSSIDIATDPLDFATTAEPVEVDPEDSGESPWDGPSRTSVVTLDSSGDFDAVAEPTPLPVIDRERFFGRIQDDQALVDYIVATGDLMIREAPPLAGKKSGRRRSEDIVFDEPVEMTPTPLPETYERRGQETLLEKARDRFHLHDFQGVVDAVERIPLAERSDEAINLLATSRVNLLKMYESKIGSTDQIPRLLVSSEEVIWLGLNHRAGFILSQIDGTVTYEDLIALSGMDRLDTIRILAELIQQKVIVSE
jgi:hypothetical protein